jgi:hypothetical protein
MCKNERKKNLYFISNSDSNSGSMNNFNIIMNNSISTEQGSSINNLKKYFKPINLSIDLSYFNISSTFKNNLITVSSPAIVGSPITVTIPNGNYNGSTLGQVVLELLNKANIQWTGGNVIVWTGTDFQVGGNFTFAYETAKPSSVTVPNASISINFINTGGFNSKKTFGSQDDFLVIPYTTDGTNATSTASTTGLMDLIPINTLFIRSNIAKSFYQMVGSNGNRKLEYTDILFTINIGGNIGGTLIVEFEDDDFYQEIKPNFSNLEFRITDKFNNLVEFLDGSEFNMVFSIETENIVLTSENINKNNIDNLKYS